MQKVNLNNIEKLDFRSRESYKTLRTNLEFAGKRRKVIAVTSCTPNEGKTSVSFQLALSMAESGKRVMLVDADLRKSVLRSIYKVSAARYGLSHYLSGQASLSEVLCETNVPDFYAVFAGPVPPNPSELLGSEAFGLLLEYLRGEYDYVVVDTPPLGSVIDSAVIAKQCDGAVLVIESGAVSYKFAQSVKDQLDRLHEVEHSADMKKHDMLDHLAKEFLPPIEREDIVSLSQNIDNITDKVEDVMLRVYMNNVRTIEPNALKMTDIIIGCCEAVKELLVEFRNFKRSKSIKQLVIRINDLEEEADKMFMESIRGLYTESQDPLKIIAWRDIYIYLERCADACEHAADVVESVIMKNS